MRERRSMSGLDFDWRLQKVVIRGGIRAGLAPLGLNDSIITTRLVGSPETDWSTGEEVFLCVSSSYPWRHHFVHEGSPARLRTDGVNGSADICLFLFSCSPKSTALAACCSNLANKASLYSKNGCRLLQSQATHTHPTPY